MRNQAFKSIGEAVAERPEVGQKIDEWLVEVEVLVEYLEDEHHVQGEVYEDSEEGGEICPQIEVVPEEEFEDPLYLLPVQPVLDRPSRQGQEDEREGEQEKKLNDEDPKGETFFAPSLFTEVPVLVVAHLAKRSCVPEETVRVLRAAPLITQVPSALRGVFAGLAPVTSGGLYADVC